MMLLRKLPQQLPLRSCRCHRRHIVLSSNNPKKVVADDDPKKVSDADHDPNQANQANNERLIFRITIAGFVAAVSMLLITDAVDVHYSRKEAVSSSVKAIISALGPDLSLEDKAIVKQVASGLDIDAALAKAWREVP